MWARTGCFYWLFLPPPRQAVMGRSRDPAQGQLLRPPWAGPVHPSGSAGLCFGSLAQAWLLHRDLGGGSLLVGPCASFLGSSAGICGLLSGGRGCLAFRQLQRCSGSGEGTELLLCRVLSASGSLGRCWRRASVQGRDKVGWAPLLSLSRSFWDAVAGFNLLGCSVLLLLLSKRLDCSLEAKGRACPGVSGLCGDRRWLPLCHPPQCSCFHIPGTEDLDRWLGLWAIVTFIAFSSYPGCLHPSVFCKMETPGLVSAGAWRGWWVPSPLWSA